MAKPHPGPAPTGDGPLPRWNPRLFCLAALLNGIVAFCILRADRYYVDDLGRVRSGYTGWTGDGRPLTSLVMETLNLGTPLTDLTPLPQILAALLLGACALLVARKFGVRDTATAAMAALPLGASPFFLENLSYRFDVLTMVLAVTLAVLAISGTPWRGRRALWGAPCLLGTLCLYQPALNVFLVLAALEFLLRMADDTPPGGLLRQAVGRLAQAVGAIIPYKLISMAVLVNTYAQGHSTLVGPGELDIVASNAQRYWELASAPFADSGGWIFEAVLSAGMLLAFGIGLRYLARGWAGAGPLGRAARLLLAPALPAVLVLCALGPLLLLKEGVFVPRVMIGVGALMCASLLLVCEVARRLHLHRAAMWVLLGVPAYAMMMLGAVYGNAMQAQERYERRICASLADDFVNLAARYEARGLRLEQYVLTGSADYPPVLDVAMAKYPYLRQLVPVYLTAGWGWVGDLFSQYDIRQAMDTLPGGLGAAVSRMCEQPPARITANYRLYVVDSSVVVAFNNARSCAGGAASAGR